MSFSSDMRKFAKKTGITIEEAAVSVCSQVVESVIEKTPVDTGVARANWIATLDSAHSGTSSAKDKSGMVAIAKANSVAKKASGKVFYLTNNLPYIRKLEFGGYNAGPKGVGGFSAQAPAGMVRITMAKLKLSLKRF